MQARREHRGHPPDQKRVRCRPARASLLLFVRLLLDEAENVEVLDLPSRKEAVHRVLLVVVKLEHGAELSQKQKLEISPVQAAQLQAAANLLQASEADHQRPEPRTVDVVNPGEIANHLRTARCLNAVDVIA